MILSETDLTFSQLIETYKEHSQTISHCLSGANFMVLDPNFFMKFSDVSQWTEYIQMDIEKYCITGMFDFRNPDVVNAIGIAFGAGVKGFKLHSYIQEIKENDFAAVLTAAQYAEKLGMFICVDTSYGTSKMYDCDNLKLSAFLSDFIKAPIILLHSGGARIWEAMLLAEDKPNIYLESSFTLPSYEGSSIESDIAFAYCKIGTHRVIYGSDHPYISIEDGIDNFLRFCEKNRFTANEIQNMMYNNASELLS